MLPSVSPVMLGRFNIILAVKIRYDNTEAKKMYEERRKEAKDDTIPSVGRRD